MSIFVDTSVLVPALWNGHVNHTRALGWLSQAMSQNEVMVSSHILVELYSILTGKAKYGAADVESTLEWVCRSFLVQELNRYDYTGAITLAMEKGLPGGAVYDALHVRAAISGGAAFLASGDKRSFPYLWPRASLINPFE